MNRGHGTRWIRKSAHTKPQANGGEMAKGNRGEKRALRSGRGAQAGRGPRYAIVVIVHGGNGEAFRWRSQPGGSGCGPESRRKRPRKGRRTVRKAGNGRESHSASQHVHLGWCAALRRTALCTLRVQECWRAACLAGSPPPGRDAARRDEFDVVGMGAGAACDAHKTDPVAKRPRRPGQH